MEHQMRYCGPRVCRAVWLLAALLSLRDVAGSRGLASDTDAPQSGPQAHGESRDAHPRQKRSWVWNQFFVLEEYTGSDPLYVGKVRCLFIFYFYFYFYQELLYQETFIPRDFLNFVIDTKMKKNIRKIKEYLQENITLKKILCDLKQVCKQRQKGNINIKASELIETTLLVIQMEEAV